MNDLIFECRNELTTKLNLLFRNVASLTELSGLAHRVEICVEDYVLQMIMYKPRFFFSNLIRKHSSLVDEYGNTYKIRMGHDFSDRNTICVILCSEKDFHNNCLTTRCASITGNGLCKKVVLKTSRNLVVTDTDLLDCISLLYESAYGWYAISIEEYVNRKSVSVGKNVYDFIRRIFCNDDLYTKFWIALVGKGYGFRLINFDQVNQLYETFNGSELSDRSINDCIDNLITTRLPYDKLLMKEALDNNTTIICDISKAKYTHDGNVYSQTMYSLYGGNAFCVYPIVRGEIGIVGLYPVDCRLQIEKLLNYYRDDISSYVKRQLEQIDLAYRLFDDKYDQKWDNGIPSEIIESGNYNSNIFIQNPRPMVNILSQYYSVCKRFGQDFVLDSISDYSGDQKQYRMILEHNNMLTKKNNGYCITPDGMRYFEASANLVGSALKNTSPNGTPIIMIGNGNSLNVDSSMKQEYVSQRDDINILLQEAFKQLSEVRLEEREYAETLLKLLEKQLADTNPKSGAVEKVLTNLSSISTLASFAISIKSLLFP